MECCTHIFPDQLRDGARQHQTGDGAAQDMEERVHDPRAGGGLDRGAEGTAERARGRSTAAAYLRRDGGGRVSSEVSVLWFLLKPPGRLTGRQTGLLYPPPPPLFSCLPCSVFSGSHFFLANLFLSKKLLIFIIPPPSLLTCFLLYG